MNGCELLYTVSFFKRFSSNKNNVHIDGISYKLGELRKYRRERSAAGGNVGDVRDAKVEIFTFFLASDVSRRKNAHLISIRFPKFSLGGGLANEKQIEKFVENVFATKPEEFYSNGI